MIRLVLSVFRQEPGEIQSLNGIRALGSVMVIFYHYWGVVVVLLSSKNSLFETVVKNLESFMDMFFVLSAFLIGGGLNYLWKKRGQVDLKNYFLKRSLRIFPAFYVALAFMVLMGYAHIANYESRTLDELGTTVITKFREAHSYWIYDALYISNYSAQRLLPHGWSLSMEEQFYLVLPFFFMWFYLKQGMKSRLFTLGLLYLLPMGFRIYNSLYLVTDYRAFMHLNYYPTHVHGDSLVAGLFIMELYFNHRDIYEKIREYRWSMGVVAMTLLFVSHLLPFNAHDIVHNALRINMNNIGFGLVFMLALDSRTLLARFLELKIFTPFARVSYSMYLYHMTALGIVGSAFFRLGVEPSLAEIVTGFGVSLVACFLLAWVSYVFVEAPFIHLKDYINRDRKVNLTDNSVEVTVFHHEQVAGRDLRFMATMLDLFMFFPAIVLYSYFRIAGGNFVLNFILALSVIIPVAVQLVFIIRYGISVGKRLFHIHVVYFSDNGKKFTTSDYLLKRVLLGNILYLYPPLGLLVDLILVAFPGGRTLRDRLSGSAVLCD